MRNLVYSTSTLHNLQVSPRTEAGPAEASDLRMCPAVFGLPVSALQIEISVWDYAPDSLSRVECIGKTAETRWEKVRGCGSGRAWRVGGRKWCL